MVGDAAWSLIGQLSREDALAYLTDRKTRGFTTVLVNLIEHSFSSRAPANFYGDRPFTVTGDFSTPNEAYFAHADYVLNQASSLGLLVLLVPAYLGFGGGNEGWYQDMVSSGVAKLRTYGEFLGNRYKGLTNILWMHGGDYNPPNQALVRSIQAGIAANNPTALHSVHCAPETTGTSYWPSEAWLSLNTVYTYGNVYDSALPAYQRMDNKPFVHIEGGYENEPTGGAGDQMQLRRQAYWALMAGGIGHVFGNNPIWHFDGPGIYSAPYDWKTALSARGSQNMTQYAALMNATTWWTLAPDTANAFLTSGAGTGTSRAFASVAPDGSAALVYMPNARAISLNLARIAGPNVRLRWFDPGSGAFSTLATQAASGTLSIPSHGNNSTGFSDWIIHAEATA